MPRLAREAWSGFRDSWERAGDDARRLLVLRLFGGVLVASAVSVAAAAALVGPSSGGPLPGDEAAQAWVHATLGVHMAVWIAAFGSSAMLVPIVAAVALLAARAGAAARSLAILLALLGCKAITNAAWAAWPRERPGGVADGLLVPSVPSLPSGHVIQAVVIYGLLAAWWSAASGRAWEKALAWGIALTIVFATVLARIRIGAHWPSDTWAALILGAGWLAWLIRAERGFTGRPGAVRGRS